MSRPKKGAEHEKAARPARRGKGKAGAGRPEAPETGKPIANQNPEEKKLKSIADNCAGQFPRSNQPSTFVSVGLLDAYSTYTYELPVSDVTGFIDSLGVAVVETGLADVQFSFTKRTGKADADLEAIYGVVVDVDRATPDIMAEVERAGVPMPTFVYPTLNGFRLAYASARPIPRAVFGEIARKLTLAIEGGDPTSWEPRQMQRLPTCIKTTDTGVITVRFTPTLTNSVPFEAKVDAVRFPIRIKRALGGGMLGAGDREAIRDYLDERGIPAPEEAGSQLYDRCPVVDLHDSKCCYVNVGAEGEITAHCLGGHDGEGEKHWAESQLAALAGVVTTGVNLIQGFDPLLDLPVTAACLEYIRASLAGSSKAEADAVVDLWKAEWACREAAKLDPELVTADMVLDVYEQRLGGIDGLPPMIAYYNRGNGQLVHDDPDGRALAVTSRSGPNLKINATELKSTALLGLVRREKGKEVCYEAGWVSDSPSYLHKIAMGHANVLAKFGIACVTSYVLPVAYATDTVCIDPRSLHIVAVHVRKSPGNLEPIDVLEFFLGLHAAGRLPLATVEDVKRFVMLLASPLLRHIAPGLLGVYWFVGPPGAGKDFLAELARHVWEAIAPPHYRVSFDISLAGELEQKRMIEMAASCVYARAKEAGKRQGMAEAIVRLAGTDILPGRGLFKEEIAVLNGFTFVAESAEDLPDRREISRRTTEIRVSFMDDKLSKGEVLDAVRAVAPRIIMSLKALVESQPAEWYLHQTDTGSRPLIPVALAKLLGATLSPVEGEDLTEVFEAMVAFIESPEGKDEGKKQLAIMQSRSEKVSLEAKTVPSYRLAYFIDVMGEKPGNAELFSPYARKSKELVTRIKRESLYRAAVAEHGYMPVKIKGTNYVLRLEDNRRFILMIELAYLTAMASASRPAPDTANDPASHTPISADPSLTSPPDAPIQGDQPVPADGVAPHAGPSVPDTPLGPMIADAPSFQAQDDTLLKKNAS
jgi:hypothetical protein